MEKDLSILVVLLCIMVGMCWLALMVLFKEKRNNKRLAVGVFVVILNGLVCIWVCGAIMGKGEAEKVSL